MAKKVCSFLRANGYQQDKAKDTGNADNLFQKKCAEFPSARPAPILRTTRQIVFDRYWKKQLRKYHGWYAIGKWEQALQKILLCLSPNSTKFNKSMQTYHVEEKKHD